MDEKTDFSKTFLDQKQRKGMFCNISNKDQSNFDYDSKVDLDSSKRHLEVLEMKISVDEKSHQDEKNHILEKSGETIKLLEDENDTLKIKTEGQADKIKQLDNANTKKDREIQKLKNKEDELSGKIFELEAQILQTKETTDEQKIEIDRLKCELGKVEKEIKQMRTKKESDEKSVQKQIQTLTTTLEKRDAEIQIRDEKRADEMQRRNEKRDAEIQIRDEKRDAEIQNKFIKFESLLEQSTLLLNQMKTGSKINDKTTINNTGNIQINQTNSNGALHSHRETFPVTKINQVFENGRRRKNSQIFRMQRGRRQQRTEKS